MFDKRINYAVTAYAFRNSGWIDNPDLQAGEAVHECKAVWQQIALEVILEKAGDKTEDYKLFVLWLSELLHLTVPAIALSASPINELAIVVDEYSKRSPEDPYPAE